jgi:hypothetical protein
VTWITIVRTEKVQVTKLKVEADVRYWEDAEVNGISDDDGTLIPCRVGDAWCPIIDLETGKIADWPENTIASIHYKVCDAGRYALLDDDGNEVCAKDGYVPAIMCPAENGYGDYIIMKVGSDGVILNFDGSDLDDIAERAK